jgi:rSAM/selenodomain-associated transferase 1
MAKPLVIVFARAPRYGAVKTRLAKDIGAAETIAFYRRELSSLMRRLRRDARFETTLAVTPDASVLERGLWPQGARLAAQGPSDLGRRMIRALRSAGARPAIVIGSDIPSIRNEHLWAAFRALGTAPVVFGPARDGGYWLIGARHPQRLKPDVLDGVRWSSPDTLSDSAARIEGARVLETTLQDIDDGAAYDAYRKSLSPATKRSTSASS